MTDTDQLNYFVRKSPWAALRFCADRLTAKELDYCVREEPEDALLYCADRLTKDQKQYCKENTK